MNKAEVVGRYKELLNDLGEDARNVVLSAGSALVMLGIRKDTMDLDVDIPTGLFNYLAKKHLVITEPGVSDLIKYAIDVDLHEFDADTGVVCVEGVWTYSPSALLIQKRYLSKLPTRKEHKRETDLDEISLLETLIRSQKLTSRVMA